MAKTVNIPVIAKEPIRNTFQAQNGEQVPRRLFDTVIVRVKENNKTEPNVTDTVEGCTGGCFGCYAARSMKVNNGKRKFHVPVIQNVVPEIVQYDLMKMVGKHPRLDWLRNGTFGDPSLDWESAAQLSEAAGMVGIRTVIISKFWTLPTDEQLIRLALSGAIIHFSLIPGYEWSPDLLIGNAERNRVQGIVSILKMYDEMTRPKSDPISDSVIVRICSAKFNRETDEGKMMDDTQQFFTEMCKKEGWRILETPWKFEGKTDPRWEFLDHDALHRQKSYATGKEGRKKTAGPVIFDGNKYLDWETFAIACDTTCDVCPNQCGTTMEYPIQILEDGVLPIFKQTKGKPIAAKN
tara:strand:- start:3062 stop:4114 length:1053 start_codon:yes stop_codon:yes gene_type:complete